MQNFDDYFKQIQSQSGQGANFNLGQSHKGFANFSTSQPAIDSLGGLKPPGDWNLDDLGDAVLWDVLPYQKFWE
jgi:hypothetical protein